MDQSLTKPQKSSLWIWTTLWLTAFVDSALIYSVFIYGTQALSGISQGFVLKIIRLIVFILSMWLGAYFAVKYVLRRTIVLKIQASKFAILAVIIPVLFGIITILLRSISGTLDIGTVIGPILAIVIIFYSIKHLISTQGD